MRLSACLIVKDEESCIEDCLKSIQGIDEIVVLDTGSTDKTGDIVRRYTDKYYVDEYKWNDDFAEARNYALKKATGDWILTIDADEQLEKDGVSKCRRAIEIAESNNHKTINFRCISSAFKEEHFQPRLYKNQADIFWKGAIHNYLNISNNNKSNIVIYYGYSLAHKKDPDRSLRILLKEVNKNPDSIREKFYLAREYWYRKDFIKAVYWYSEYLKISNWAPEQAEAWLMLAKCYFNIKESKDAMNCCLKAVSINTNFKAAIIFLANLSGPKNKKRWLEFAETATDENVLFVRN